MTYVSTRGKAPVLGFEDAMLSGLARDGGLYVPAEWPDLGSTAVQDLSGLPYAEAAARVMAPFMGGAIELDELASLTAEAYATFTHKAAAPLIQLGPNDWVLELFHGPTFAFKDVAMQVLGRLMDRALKRRGAKATVVGATSGDTGSAAIEAFRGRDAIDIFILHPHGRTSEVQRRQMTTVVDPNVHNIAIEGSFDDCQALVKGLFNDHALRDRLQLAGVNSINWARVMAQSVYFLTAASSLGAPDRDVVFSVPTGNFGDVFAGYVAQRIGYGIAHLIIATNVNDILARTLASGRYEPRAVQPSMSPSMDIQVSSNFERLLFEASGRDGARVASLMQDLAGTGAFVLSRRELDVIRQGFSAARADEAETLATIARVHAETGYVLDPHTAVGVAAARSERRQPLRPRVTLATAHPAKFPDAVERAIGRRPVLPDRLAAAMEAEERFDVLPNDLGGVAAYISARARIEGVR